MADTKISGFTATTAPVAADIAPIVIDTAGTPLNRKVTLSDLITKAHGLSNSTAGQALIVTGGAIANGSVGTVTTVSVVTANGVSGSVATATTTPAITLTLGAITPTSVNGVVISGASTPTLAVTGTSTISGTNTGDQTSVSGNAGTVTVADAGADTTTWVLLGTSQTGNLSPATDAGLTYNANTDALTATTFIGALTGNASTATALATPRTIGGVSFDGTANITVSTATGGFTVSGGNLALGTNSITMSGSIGVTGTRVTKGWFTDLECTNAMVGSITGNAATVTVADAASDTTTWVLLGTSQTGNMAPATDAGLTYNASTNALTATTFIGALTGTASNVTTNANLTGHVTSTGNAAVLGSFTIAQLNTAVSDADVATIASPTFTGTVTLPTVTANGIITLAENTSLALDPAGSADGKYSGITIAGTAGATLAFGDVIYLDPTDSRWELTDANSAAGADGDARGLVGICVLAAAGDGSATTILLMGTIRADAAFPALTIGAPVYVSETAGDIVVAQPTTTDAVIRVLGSALTADEILFHPSADYITHT